jgi:lipopolysaccharide export system protein LptA
MSLRFVLNFSRPGALLLAIGLASQAGGQALLEFGCLTSSGTDREDVCVEATVTDGTTTITAGVMTRRMPDEGEWQLTEGVGIASAEAELSADSAVVSRADGEYRLFELAGSPSRVRLTATEGRPPVSAEATSIVYDLDAGLLRLSGDVRFVFGENVLDTCEQSYDLNQRSYSTGACGVRATVPARQAENWSESESEPSAAQRSSP